jgi:hypothetical protein
MNFILSVVSCPLRDHSSKGCISSTASCSFRDHQARSKIESVTPHVRLQFFNSALRFTLSVHHVATRFFSAHCCAGLDGQARLLPLRTLTASCATQVGRDFAWFQAAELSTVAPPPLDSLSRLLAFTSGNVESRMSFLSVNPTLNSGLMFRMRVRQSLLLLNVERLADLNESTLTIMFCIHCALLPAGTDCWYHSCAELIRKPTSRIT